jgi:hypothetical protein
VSWPFIWRKTADAELAVWKERASERLQRAKTAERAAATEASAKRTIAALYADLCDSHGLPMPVDPDYPDRQQAVQAMAAFDEAQARKAADRIARLQKAVARGRVEAASERRRADGLQARLDDAVGLNTPKIAAGSDWQDRRETRMQYDPPTSKPTVTPTAEEATA